MKEPKQGKKTEPGVNDILTAVKVLEATAKSQSVQIDSIVAARQDNVPAGFGSDAGFGEEVVSVTEMKALTLALQTMSTLAQSQQTLIDILSKVYDVYGVKPA